MIHLVGYGSGTGSTDPRSGEAALFLKNSPYLAMLNQLGLSLKWEEIFSKRLQESEKSLLIANLCQQLAKKIAVLCAERKIFTVIGGDHSCAVGTWSGVSHALKKEGPVGLIWIDAHMDSHTPETSHTGNIHGMPLAFLLGKGPSYLRNILNDQAKIKPENLCLIGVRSYEAEEAELLKQLKVRIFFMDEIKQRGLNSVMAEALSIVNQNTVAFGVSIDIDSIDPSEAPGTGAPAADGLTAFDLIAALRLISQEAKLVGVEIAEFNPSLDQNYKTETLICSMLASLFLKDEQLYQSFQNSISLTKK